MKENQSKTLYKNIYQKLKNQKADGFLNANLIDENEKKIYSQTIILQSPNFSVNNTYISGNNNTLNNQNLWNPRVNSALDNYPTNQSKDKNGQQSNNSLQKFQQRQIMHAKKNLATKPKAQSRVNTTQIQPSNAAPCPGKYNMNNSFQNDAQQNYPRNLTPQYVSEQNKYQTIDVQNQSKKTQLANQQYTTQYVQEQSSVHQRQFRTKRIDSMNSKQLSAEKYLTIGSQPKIHCQAQNLTLEQNLLQLTQYKDKFKISSNINIKNGTQLKGQFKRSQSAIRNQNQASKRNTKYNQKMQLSEIQCPDSQQPKKCSAVNNTTINFQPENPQCACSSSNDQEEGNQLQNASNYKSQNNFRHQKYILSRIDTTATKPGTKPGAQINGSPLKPQQPQATQPRNAASQIQIIDFKENEAHPGPRIQVVTEEDEPQKATLFSFNREAKLQPRQNEDDLKLNGKIPKVGGSAQVKESEKDTVPPDEQQHAKIEQSHQSQSYPNNNKKSQLQKQNKYIAQIKDSSLKQSGDTNNETNSSLQNNGITPTPPKIDVKNAHTFIRKIKQTSQQFEKQEDLTKEAAKQTQSEDKPNAIFHRPFNLFGEESKRNLLDEEESLDKSTRSRDKYNSFEENKIIEQNLQNFLNNQILDTNNRQNNKIYELIRQGKFQRKNQQSQ